MRTNFTTILLTIFFINISLNNYAQNAEKLFKKKYPKLYKELKISSQADNIAKDVIESYRAVLVRLSDALDDITAYEAGALTDENYKIFRAKELKKSKDVPGIKSLVVKNIEDIKMFLGTKTKFGADEQNCKKNLSLYSEFTKQKNYENAYKPWKVLLKYYPISNKKIYSKGTKIAKYKINKSKGEAKNKWIDTLMLVYDLRIKYFGNNRKYPKSYILGEKGKDLFKYREDDAETAYKYIEESVKLRGLKSSQSVLQTYMQITEYLFNDEELDAVQVVDNFTTIMDILEKQLKSSTKPKKKTKIQKAIGGVEKIFTNSKAASCEELVKAFTPKFENNKEDKKLLDKILTLLDKKECTDSKLYSDVVIQLNVVDPSAKSACGLARSFYRKGAKKDKAKDKTKDVEYNKAIEYYKQAIELEKDDLVKALYNYELALTYNKLKKKGEARKYALEAAKLKSDYGAPFLLIATLYASTSCGDNSFKKKYVYWVAVDKLIKARTVDPSVKEAVNQLIGGYKARFPKKEEGFMQGVTPGKTIRVACWINESTTARFIK